MFLVFLLKVEAKAGGIALDELFFFQSGFLSACLWPDVSLQNASVLGEIRDCPVITYVQHTCGCLTTVQARHLIVAWFILHENSTQLSLLVKR